jgi:hypothetical protein
MVRWLPFLSYRRISENHMPAVLLTNSLEPKPSTRVTKSVTNPIPIARTTLNVIAAGPR